MTAKKTSAVLLAALWLSATAPNAQEFVPDDVVVSDCSVQLRDPEFDGVGNRMTWQDGDGNLWVAAIDPDTGFIDPPAGMGQLVDTGLASLGSAGNGPEWVYGDADASVYIAYTKALGPLQALAVAWENFLGNWTAGLVRSPLGRWRPFGAQPSTVDPARLIYIRSLAGGGSDIGWRNLDGVGAETTLDISPAQGGKWAAGERAFLTLGDVDGFDQLFWVNINTQEVTQVTTSDADKINASTWFAPEYNDESR